MTIISSEKGHKPAGQTVGHALCTRKLATQAANGGPVQHQFAYQQLLY